MELPAGRLLGAVVLLLAAASLSLLFRLFVKHLAGKPLLDYAPRRPVPWTAVAPLAIVAPLLLLVAAQPEEDLAPAAMRQAQVQALAAATAAAQGGAAIPAAAALESAALAYRDAAAADRTRVAGVWSQVALLGLLLAACLTLLTRGFGATAADLGLPASWGEFRRDAALGFTACLAALVPVYGLHVLLVKLLMPEHGHPLVEQLAVNHSPAMFVAAAVVAIVAAPVFEETAFRLILQGWLERREDDVLRVAAGESSPYGAAGVVPGLRHGWAPILTTAMLFGLAHWGHGVAPLAIVLLGVVLGYLYQRTHRIVPSIACHMMFNFLSLAALAAQLVFGIE